LKKKKKKKFFSKEQLQKALPQFGEKVPKPVIQPTSNQYGSSNTSYGSSNTSHGTSSTSYGSSSTSYVPPSQSISSINNRDHRDHTPTQTSHTPIQTSHTPIQMSHNKTPSVTSSPSNTTTQQLKFFLIDKLFNDDDFKDELSKLVKIVMNEELDQFKNEVRDLTESLQPLPGGQELNEVEITTSVEPKAQQIISQEFPGCSVFRWTSQNTTSNVVKGENSRFIYEVIPSVSVQDLERVIKTGKLYKAQYPSFPLSCFIITSSNVNDNVLNVAHKCKIKIFKV